MFRIIYLKGDMFCITLDHSRKTMTMLIYIYIRFFRSTDFSFYLFNQFDWPKITCTEYLLHRFHRGRRRVAAISSSI